MKVLGIDLGKKRIGVALGDTVNKIAVGLPTLVNNKSVLSEIQKIIEKEDIKKIIVGLPRTLNDQIGSQARYTQKWANNLAYTLGVEVEYEDERLSSKLARDSLIAIGKELTKEDIDQAAAVLILQSYLDKLK